MGRPRSVQTTPLPPPPPPLPSSPLRRGMRVSASLPQFTGGGTPTHALPTPPGRGGGRRCAPTAGAAAGHCPPAGNGAAGHSPFVPARSPGGGGTGVGGGTRGDRSPAPPRHRSPAGGTWGGGKRCASPEVAGHPGIAGTLPRVVGGGGSGSTRGIRDGGVGRARCPGKPTLPSPRGFNPVPVLPPPRPIVYTARRWFRSWGRPRGGGRRGETTWKLPPSPRGPPPGVTSSPDRWPRP